MPLPGGRGAQGLSKHITSKCTAKNKRKRTVKWSHTQCIMAMMVLWLLRIESQVQTARSQSVKRWTGVESICIQEGYCVCTATVVFLLFYLCILSYTRMFLAQWTRCEQTLSTVWSNGSKNLCSSLCGSNSDDLWIKRLNTITALLELCHFCTFQKEKLISC